MMSPDAAQLYDELCRVVARHTEESDLSMLEAIGALETVKLEIAHDALHSEDENDTQDTP